MMYRSLRKISLLSVLSIGLVFNAHAIFMTPPSSDPDLRVAETEDNGIQLIDETPIITQNASEPSSWALFGMGLLGLMGARKLSKQS